MLQKLIDECKGSVNIEINSHRDVYDSIVNYLGEEADEISKDILNNMIEKDTMIRIEFYPKTTLDYYVVYHYDINMALQKSLKIIDDLLM